MNTTNMPDLSASSDWIVLKPHSSIHSFSFVSGGSGSSRLRVKYYRNRTDNRFMGRVWFGPHAEGPPGRVHGGAIAAVLDDGMGAAAFFAGYRAITARLRLRLKKMIPVDTVLTLEAWEVRVKGEAVIMEGRLVDAVDNICCQAEGLFIKLSPKDFGAELVDM